MICGCYISEVPPIDWSDPFNCSTALLHLRGKKHLKNSNGATAHGLVILDMAPQLAASPPTQQLNSTPQPIRDPRLKAPQPVRVGGSNGNSRKTEQNRSAAPSEPPQEYIGVNCTLCSCKMHTKDLGTSMASVLSHPKIQGHLKGAKHKNNQESAGSPTQGLVLIPKASSTKAALPKLAPVPLEATTELLEASDSTGKTSRAGRERRQGGGSHEAAAGNPGYPDSIDIPLSDEEADGGGGDEEDQVWEQPHGAAEEDDEDLYGNSTTIQEGTQGSPADGGTLQRQLSQRISDGPLLPNVLGLGSDGRQHQQELKGEEEVKEDGDMAELYSGSGGGNSSGGSRSGGLQVPRSLPATASKAPAAAKAPPPSAARLPGIDDDHVWNRRALAMASAAAAAAAGGGSQGAPPRVLPPPSLLPLQPTLSAAIRPLPRPATAATAAPLEAVAAALDAPGPSGSSGGRPSGLLSTQPSAALPAFLEPAFTPKSKQQWKSEAARSGGGGGQVSAALTYSPTAATPPTPAPKLMVEQLLEQLLTKKQLALVLDLDHTLVNSVRWEEVDPAGERVLRAQSEAASPQVFSLSAVGMWTKLRPGVRQFLDAAAQNFQLWIHTNGNQPYAAAIAGLLDPTGKLFGTRVIAQDAEVSDSPTAQIKSFAHGLEGLECLSVIVDDSLSVWPNHTDSLLPVERYVYFPSSRRRLGLPGASLMEAGRDECSERGMLSVVREVLMRVHWSVFQQVSQQSPGELKGQLREHGVGAPWDVRRTLEVERKRVLAGCFVMFSRAIPLGQEPSTHRLWQQAERFGATCCKDTEDRVTHVVAGAPGTEKALWGVRTGRHVVGPSWLEASCVLWMRAWEGDHPVPGHPPPG